MGYKMATGDRWARTRNVTLQASVTKTASFNGAAVELGDAATLRIDLTNTAHAGTAPTLDVKIQTSYDGSTNWTDVPNGAFAQIGNTNTTKHLVVSALDRFVRVVATISASGGDSYTYSVTGEMV